MEFHHIAGANALEEPLDVRVAKANTAVGLGVANRGRLIGAMDAVPFLVQANPPRADWVLRSGGDYLARVVVGGIGDAADDGECAGGARRVWRTNSDREHLHDLVVLDHRKLPVRNAHDQPANRSLVGYVRRVGAA